MPLSELIVRSLPLAIITVSALYVAVSALRARVRRSRGVPVPGVYPGSREEAGDAALGWWRSLSTEEQAAADEEAIAGGGYADGFDAACRGLEEQRARDAVLRASEVNALYHP